MVTLSHTLHCLSHRRPYYVPYLAWRILFLSSPSFNANTLMLAPYSTGYFDIRLHFLRVWFFHFYFLSLFGESVRRSVCAGGAWMRSQLGDGSERGAARGSRGISRRRRGKRQRLEWARASGEWEKRAGENWESLWSPTLQIRGAERGSKWPVLCGCCHTLKSQSHLQHSLHQVH